jgi:hypothetical protein
MLTRREASTTILAPQAIRAVLRSLRAPPAGAAPVASQLCCERLVLPSLARITGTLSPLALVVAGVTCTAHTCCNTGDVPRRADRTFCGGSLV